MSNMDKMLDTIFENDRECDICRYRIECKRVSVRLGPLGPLYSPCTDGDTESFVEEDLVEEVYNEIIEELNS